MTSNVVTEISENTCVVCFKSVVIYSVGECDHPVCYECSTRMRVLCRQNECPICRQDMPKVKIESLRRFLIILCFNTMQQGEGKLAGCQMFCVSVHHFRCRLSLPKRCSCSEILRTIHTWWIKNLRYVSTPPVYKQPIANCWNMCVLFAWGVLHLEHFKTLKITWEKNMNCSTVTYVLKIWR